MPTTLHLPPHLAAALQSAAASPHEVCGILLGHSTPTTIHITSLLPAPNLSPTPLIHYLIDPRALLAAERASTPASHIVGFYHSHPTSPPIPSKTDLADAWELYIYLIASPKTATLRAWQRPTPTAPFHEIPITFGVQPSG